MPNPGMAVETAAGRGYTPSVFGQTTHTDLLRRVSAGDDPAAWQEFHDRYAQLITGFVRRKGLQPADCDDILQEVLMSLTRRMPGFHYDPSKGKFRSYLMTVTVRAICKRQARKRGEVFLDHVEETSRAACSDHATEQAWEEEWRDYHLRQAMRTIAVEFNTVDRQAFQRYAIEGGDARQTAEALQISVDQVYRAKSRILKRLSMLIAEQSSEEG